MICLYEIKGGQTNMEILVYATAAAITLIGTYITTQINSSVQLKQIDKTFQNEMNREKMKIKENRKDEAIKRKRESLEKLAETLIRIQTEHTLTENYMLQLEGDITKEKEKIFIEYHKKMEELEKKAKLQIIMNMPQLKDSFNEMKGNTSCAWGSQKNFFIQDATKELKDDSLDKYVQNIHKVRDLCEDMLYDIEVAVERL